MLIDIIILSNGKTQPLIELTQRTIDSCIYSEKDIQFNIVVIEQEPNVIYNNCITRHVSEPFNYNAFMNIGVNMTANKYVCLCNNDLVFSSMWATNIISAMQNESVLSASPLCPNQTKKAGAQIEYGYNNSHHMSGWCIMIDRELFEIIGKLNSEFPFWFADNEYSEQLKHHGIKHILVRNSVVRHLGSKTLHSISTDLHNEYTTNQIEKFIERYPDNESSRYFRTQRKGKGTPFQK